MKNNNKKKKAIEIVLEKEDDILWGRVEGKGKFMPTPYGETKEAVIANFKDLVKDYLEHEGKDDAYWSKVDVDNIEITFVYDVESFFEEHNYLKISSVARKAGINEGLLRQYASGAKHPSAEQAKKIEDTIHALADELKDASIYA